MTARSQARCSLQVEFLESRSLPSGVDPVAYTHAILDHAGAPEPNPPAVVTGQVSSSTDSVATDDQLQYSDGSDAAARSPRGRDTEDSLEHYSDPRARNADEARETLARERLSQVPVAAVAQALPISAPAPTSGEPTHLANGTQTATGPAAAPANQSQASGELHSPADSSGPSGSLTWMPDRAAVDTDVIAPSPCDPSASAFPDVISLPPTLEATLPAWRDVFRDPLAGIPIEQMVPADLSSLGTQTRELFDHLVNLEPGWLPEWGWSDYVCLTAGILLAGGGVHYARAISARRARASRAEEAMR